MHEATAKLYSELHLITEMMETTMVVMAEVRHDQLKADTHEVEAQD